MVLIWWQLRLDLEGSCVVGDFRWVLYDLLPPGVLSAEAPSLETWVAVKELKLSYHNPETMLFSIYPFYGSLN